MPGGRWRRGLRSPGTPHPEESQPEPRALRLPRCPAPSWPAQPKQLHPTWPCRGPTATLVPICPGGPASDTWANRLHPTPQDSRTSDKALRPLWVPQSLVQTEFVAGPGPALVSEAWWTLRSPRPRQPDVKRERNTASRFRGARPVGSPEDTQILAEVAKEELGDQGLLGGHSSPQLGQRPLLSPLRHVYPPSSWPHSATGPGAPPQRHPGPAQEVVTCGALQASHVVSLPHAAPIPGTALGPAAAF
ncbi:Sortilin-Related Receptor [Manis pentadactyla]|nr:Sortilin-Related Receptor [Manis pentadactyla]